MPTSLRVWSFHKSMTREAKEDLLKHFGATAVEHVGRRGREEAVLASFRSASDCRFALGKLHQQEILGVRLKALYKDSTPPPPSPQPHRCKENVEPDKASQEEETQRKIKEFEVNLCSIASSLGITHPIPPNLRYVYPPPSACVIANITESLVDVPKFYTQVLHLMNKMNLPPPFQPVSALRPIHRELLLMLGAIEPPPTTPTTTTTTTTTNNPQPDSSSSSTSESELESDDEEPSKTKPHITPYKRPLPRQTHKQNKRPKLSLLKQNIPPVTTHTRSSEVTVKDVFEATQTPGSKKLEVRLRDAVLPVKDDLLEAETCVERGSFGKMEALSQVKNVETESAVEWAREADKYIKREDILANRVAKSEWPILPVFKNYSQGEPSAKLYIKNLAKTTSERDLKYIFGRYVFWQNDEEASMFSITVMREGRMKGQAFVTFPSVRQASEALNDTNGYILNDKPMVVVFGKVRKERQEKIEADADSGGGDRK